MQRKSDVHWPSIPYPEYAGRIENLTAPYLSQERYVAE